MFFPSVPYLWVVKALSSSSVYSTKVSVAVAHVLFLVFLTGSAYSLEYIHEPGSRFEVRFLLV